MTEAAPSGPAPTIFAAIVRRQCVSATYNRGELILAPHIIYTRHGEMYVDAITITRNGAPPRETKLGTFKLDGLGDLNLTQTGFDINPLFEPEAERYAGETLVAVEPG
ncbi:hypothetical protein [Stakelama saccharophila]|uniref:WYL domain-containing protein n=1 Tax=Stakelama saccharophila TaxID=3075605 RepID=A0ABZ0B7G9_9SPHN|nr:hypothetical protein [Stakelama sp. W311]WNO52808.1 hypothetical protein RPR59_10090 [Stakelama sp. W311]